MINNYLKYLQEDKEDKEDLNEFIVIPLIYFLTKNLYKKYVEYKKIIANCIGLFGDEKQKCFLIHKIKALESVLEEVKKLTSKCKDQGIDVNKCVKSVNKEVGKLNKEISFLKTKLSKL